MASPTKTGNTQVDNIVAFIYKTWPDLASHLPPERVQAWADELNSGSGRTYEELRSDIFKYVVTPDRVREYARAAFTERGLNIATGDETEEERLDRITEELMSGSRTFLDLNTTLDKFGRREGEGDPADLNPDDDVDVTRDAPEEEDRAERGVGGGSDELTTILTSKSMEWFFDPNSGKWYVSYKLPNSERRAFFEATGAQLDAIFGEGVRPANYQVTTLAELAQRDGYVFSGDIAEVQGTGSFEAEVERVIALALDEGRLPEWASESGAVMDILYIAQAEGKSDEWIIEQISTLPEFKERFPHIEALQNLGLTVTEAVTGFLEFEHGLKQLVLRDGGDPNSVTPDEVGAALAKGHSLEDAQFVFRIFDTMEKNQGALEAFNQVLAARGAEPLDEDGWFDFLAGNAPKELYDIWEESSLLRAAEDAGLNIDVNAAIDLARRTEGLTSYEGALEGLSVAARNLLQFRTEIALDRYGLNEQDLIDLSLNLAPSSGTSQAEIARNIERAVGAAKAQTQRARVNPFKRFTDEGTPQAASLSKLRQEG